MSFSAAVPILPSTDFDRTVAFYKTLGFALRGRWNDEYLIVASGSVELHFFFAREHDPATSDFMSYLRAADTDALYARYAALGHPLGRFGAPRVQGPPDGDGEFAVIDPDGTLLRIGREK